MLDCCSASKGCGIWRHSNNRLLQNLQTPLSTISTGVLTNSGYMLNDISIYMYAYGILYMQCIHVYMYMYVYIYIYWLCLFWRFSIFALLLHPTKTARICMAQLGTKHLQGNEVLSHREERIIVLYTNLLKFQQKNSELMKSPQNHKTVWRPNSHVRCKSKVPHTKLLVFFLVYHMISHISNKWNLTKFIWNIRKQWSFKLVSINSILVGSVWQILREAWLGSN